VLTTEENSGERTPAHPEHEGLGSDEWSPDLLGERRVFACLRTLAVIATLVVSAENARCAEPNTLTKEELADGWILLFDGQTVFGWKATSKANWKVADGVISVSEGEPGFLHTTSQFGDFVLKADFKSAAGTNSGIFLHTSPQPKDPTKDCYELNIADQGTTPFPTGSFVGRKKSDVASDSREWQTFEVTARGGEFLVKLDSKTVLEYSDARPLGRGYISLQLNKGEVQFRNIKLKPLSLESIFNGKDLSGWKVLTGAKNKSEFSATPKGELNVRNGPGALESEGQWADFVLQLEVLSAGKHLNSGVFFRSIPGEFWQGYESQVHNGYKGTDRTQPLDFGTGGFYRRQKARKVVAEDFEWFHKTLIVSGNHMAAWVNGYPVSDWTDDRKADPNPRNGLRREKGTLQIQGHDPTTNLSFRNIKISELPPRSK
jgi:hypothetical protein